MKFTFITPCGSPFTPAQDKADRDRPYLPPQPRACLRPCPPAMRITSKLPEEVRPLSQPGAHFSLSFVGYALNSSCKTQLQCHLLWEAPSNLWMPKAELARRPPLSLATYFCRSICHASRHPDDTSVSSHWTHQFL